MPATRGRFKRHRTGTDLVGIMGGGAQPSTKSTSPVPGDAALPCVIVKKPALRYI